METTDLNTPTNIREANTPLESALAYAARGWPVLPIYTIRGGRCSCTKSECASPGKHPRTNNGLKDASKDRAQIDEWWNSSPDANIGIATGEASGLLVLDIDPAYGGNDSLQALEKQHGELPKTIQALTGGGGRHLYFKHPGHSLGNRQDFPGPGLDIRGDGGYIVAPPSRHRSGESYRWDGAQHPDDLELAEVPAWLLDLLLNGHQHPNVTATTWQKFAQRILSKTVAAMKAAATDDQRALLTKRYYLLGRLLGGKCPDPDQVGDEIREALDAGGYEEWWADVLREFYGEGTKHPLGPDLPPLTRSNF